MKISSEQVDSRNAIKGSTRRIRELLKPPSQQNKVDSYKKSSRSKFSRGKCLSKNFEKGGVLRESLNMRDKDGSGSLFRTDEFRTPKLGKESSLFVYRKEYEREESSERPKNFSSFNHTIGRSKLEIENLLREQNQHLRKKSFQRHFERKILKPKLALTFNKKKEINDLKSKYARTGKHKRGTTRGFKGKNLGPYSKKREGASREKAKAPKSKIYNIETNNLKHNLKFKKKKNLSSGKKILDMFASQTLNPIRKKTDSGNLDQGSRRKIANKQYQNYAKSKYSNRKVLAKTANLNPFGLPFKTSKNIFLELDFIKKDAGMAKKQSKMPVISSNKKPMKVSTKQRRVSRRNVPKTKDYNVSCSNHNNQEISHVQRVKLASIKSYSKVDNSVTVDNFDKFFRIFKKKKKHSHFTAAPAENSNTSTPNIYKNPKSKFKSFRQLTMQRYSKRNISKPQKKRKKDSVQLGKPIKNSFPRDVVSDSKQKNCKIFFKKNNIWSDEGMYDDNLHLGENIYNPKIYNSQPEKNRELGQHRVTTLSRKMENDVEKFHREYIKIDCMESDSDSANAEHSGKGVRGRASRDGKASTDNLKTGHEKGTRKGKSDLVINLENEIQIRNLKLNEQNERNNIYKHGQDEQLNVSFDSLEREQKMNTTSKPVRLGSRQREDKSRSDYGPRLKRQIDEAMDQINEERKAKQSQKIKKVRLIDSYNLESLYDQSAIKQKQKVVNTHKLKSLLKSKNHVITYQNDYSMQPKNVVMENLSGEWKSDFQGKDRHPPELDFIKIENGDNSSLELEDLSIQKSIEMQSQIKENTAHPQSHFNPKKYSQVEEETRKMTESQPQTMKNRDYLNHLLNYESEKSHKKKSKKPEHFKLKTRKKKRKDFKRKSEHGVPLKISSFREKKLRGNLSRGAERQFKFKPSADLVSPSNLNFKSMDLN